MKTYKLHTVAVNGGPFNCAPAGEYDVKPERIAVNGDSCSLDFPWDGKCTGFLWVIGNEYGVCGAVVACDEQEAFDTLVDRGLAGGLAIDEDDSNEDTARLGNAGEPHDLTHAWIRRVAFDPARDIVLICNLVRVIAEGGDTLAN